MPENEIKRQANGKPYPPEHSRFTSENQPEGRGRPKGSVSIVKHIRRLLAENDEAGAISLARKMISLAKAGNAAAIKEIIPRIDGVIPDEKHLTGEITLKVVYEDEPGGDESDLV